MNRGIGISVGSRGAEAAENEDHEGIYDGEEVDEFR